MSLEPGTRLGPYEILAPLGAGGMGEVYRARDTKLDREVALKTLPAELSRHRERLARFDREAKLLAALNHPHIASIYGLDEADGRPFLILELVEGEDLEQRLRRGPLPLDGALALARQIAEALEAAHARGIVHRDLKPANVKLSAEGVAKVLDFGLARAYGPDGARQPSSAVSQSPTEPHPPPTATGAVLGTAAYMSPEQARGEPLDKRTDIWAFGVVLFEMLTGRRLFGRESFAETLAAVLERDVDFGALPRSVPPGVRRVLERCLQKDRERRLRDVADARLEIEEALGGSVIETSPLPPPTATRTTWRWAVPAGLVAVALAVLGFRALRDPTSPPVPTGKIDSLVVLPLDNLMNDPEQDYLVHGMHEALITELSRIGALAVISRTSALAYEGQPEKTVPEIARDLDVDAVVEGSVLRVGDTVRITVQLIEGPTDRHLWADNFDREMSDVLALLSEVARAVAREVEVSLTPAEDALLASERPVEPDAYELYLRGREARFTSESEDDLERAERYYRLAIERQPEFSQAWAGLGDLLFLRWLYGRGATEELVPAMRDAARRALEYDPTSPEAHVTASLVNGWVDGDIPRAERDLLRALEIDPRHWNARREYAQLLRRMERLDEALIEFQWVQKRDPVSSLALVNLGRIHFLRREYDEARAWFERVSGPPLFLVSACLIARGASLRETRDALERWREQRDFPLALAYAFAAAGEEENALRLIETHRSDGSSMTANCGIPAIHGALGRTDTALALLEETRDHGRLGRWTLGKCDLGTNPLYDPIRAAPRFSRLLESLGVGH